MDQDKYKKKYMEYQRGGGDLAFAAALGAATVPVSAVINTATGLLNKENMDAKFARKILKQIFKDIGIIVSSFGLLNAVIAALKKHN